MYLLEEKPLPPVLPLEDEITEGAELEPIAQARKIRSLIFHLLYASYAHDYQTSLASIVDNLNRGFNCDIDPQSPMVATVQHVIDNREKLDQLLIPLLDKWRLERVGTCTRLILWLALWELLNTDTDPKIIINEAIELAKCFAEKDAYRFVNGVLDQALKSLAKDSVAIKSDA